MKRALLFALPLVSLFISLPAQAYELETGTVLLCDTQKQAERLAQLFDGSLQGAVSAINNEAHDPSACGVADVAYVQGPEITLARGQSHTFRIMPIVVVAANTPDGFQAAKPALFFALVEVEEYTA